MRRLLVCLALALFAAPAAACINDSELPSHEREFKSQYRGTGYSPVAPTDSPAQNIMIGGGGVLLGGAAAMVVTGGRRRK
jgi:hypothetical protein